MNSLECACFPLHDHLVGSNPCRRLSLLGFAHLVVGSPFQVQDRYRQITLLRGWDYEAGQIVALIHVLCIY